MKKLSYFSIFFFLLLTANLFAINELTVRVPDIYGFKPGYMEKVTLVVEPHGGYVEQSLYVEYGDRKQYYPSNNVEVIHRFELPKGSVVNDLYLWIDGKVMRALILNTWTARKIYDSIVAMKRDPAFLAKKGDQYELHIYPLKSGTTRKIKLNFITPTQWLGNQASAELPYRFLNANNSLQKPIDILFRSPSNSWGIPSMQQFSDKKFVSLKDTMNYHYKLLPLPDIANKTNLSLLFTTEFENGYYYTVNENKKDYTYYQLGILPEKFFSVQADLTAKKVLVGLDLSGRSNNDITKIIANLKTTLKSALKSNDLFNIIMAGGGMIEKLNPVEILGTPANIDYLCALAASNRINDTLRNIKPLNLLFCDDNAYTCWNFPTLDKYAKFTTTGTIKEAVQKIYNYNSAAAYSHGFESVLDNSSYQTVKAKLDTFFILGGHFLTYFDRNRTNGEKIAKGYINGLQVKSSIYSAVTLFRTPDGNISGNFPVQYDRSSGYFLQFDDPNVKKEVVDKDGNPMVISKRIGNGILVVSGIWEFNDDASLRTIQGIPLMGLNKNINDIQLMQLLMQMRKEYDTFTFDKAIVFSNSDSVIQKTDAVKWADSYIGLYPGKKPVFNTVNLLDGLATIPPYISENLIDYYGSGYMMKSVAAATFGAHFETHLSNWSVIASSLNALAIPKLENKSIKIIADNGSGRSVEQWEINPNDTDPARPLFFIGSTTAQSEITCEISAKYSGINEQKIKSVTIPVSHDTVNTEQILPAMLAQENLKVMFAKTPPLDTAKIMNYAFNSHLLCDFTALLALEPNDTIKFVDKFFDETTLTPVELSAFTASVKDNSIILKWTTATESNNRGFEIERKMNNSWSVIGFISGKGTTSIIQNYTFTDKDLIPGKYSYRLKQYDYNGAYTYYNLLGELEIGKSMQYILSQNHPNPFNPVTSINYYIPADGKVTLVVYNSLGQSVKVLVDEVKTSGSYSVQFNADNLSSGVYFYTLTSGNFTASKKLIIMK